MNDTKPHLISRLFVRKSLLCFATISAWAMSAAGQVRVTHGPVVGAVTAESARLLVRTEEAADVRFELDTQPSFPAPITTTSATTRAEDDFFLVIDATELAPETHYHYRAVIDNVPQDDARSFMTFPLPGTEATFSFAFGGCQQAADDPRSFIGRVFPLIAADRPRFFLQLGDWTYPDTTDNSSNPTDYFNVDFARVQATYRSKYDPTYLMNDLLKVTAVDYVYDDHDYTNNNSDRTFPARENSINGYRSMFPHYPLPNGDNGIWHKFTFGQAEFFMLDTRTQRDPNVNAFREDSEGRLVFEPDDTHSLLQADPTISGELQMDWLIRELQASIAHWKFICTTVPFNPGHRALLEFLLVIQGTELDPISLLGDGVPAATLAVLFADSWHSFPLSVRRLVKAVNDAEIQNVIMLSGDSHTAAIDDGASSLFPEVMAGGLDRSNSRLVAAMEVLGLQLWNQGGQTLQRGNFNSHYGRATVFGADSVRFEIIDEFGNLITDYTLRSGHLVSKRALTYAVQGLDFGAVNLGEAAAFSLLLMNTGVDTIRVSNVRSSEPQFELDRNQLTLPAGIREDVVVTFRPQNVGNASTIITVVSDDPESPFEIRMRGRGVRTTSITDAGESLPEDFVLEQNYPNPFNATTRIGYQLSKRANVDLRIFNLLGEEVRRFTFHNQAPGRYFVDWDAKDNAGNPVASGVYTYNMEITLSSGSLRSADGNKMIFLK